MHVSIADVNSSILKP